ncbi:hypothetical protein FisN_29Lh052 [Fistulifera solaris]|uniref:Uncharacterized protein n=1 Tax=Fistulifera solaris TaxID=1519565 RepID=A0A1Z5JLH7_FISSO|nr:hypothetical protein FisN_29Lh052 [Fistulifera solaris]|eukprot:GAX14844.1 hypothetical protein FisN_29Lh052 [Fistulifera solaris]
MPVLLIAAIINSSHCEDSPPLKGRNIALNSYCLEMRFLWLLSIAVGLPTTTIGFSFHRSAHYYLTHHHKINTPVITHKSSSLHSTTSNNQEEPVNGAIPATVVDTDALVKYAIAITTQLSLFAATFAALDWLLQGRSVPMALNAALFYAMALKSRVFNPLSNQRPQVKSLEATNQKKRSMPSWTPPGVVFPIVWLLLIGPLRAIASSLVYQATQSYAHPAILALVLHLAIGDTWNTINNVEQRYGTAVVGVVCVWLSKAYAAYQYYQIVPLAGKLLAITLVWLTIAATLVTATWRLNPDDATGQPQSLIPVRGSVKTTFQWFSKKQQPEQESK